VGLYLEAPKVVVSASSEGDPSEEWRAISESICEIGSSVNVRIASSPPKHVGLGSTTQISMSAAMALRTLCRRKLSYKDLALITGRGAVSGIGIHAFRYGGLIVDGGRRNTGVLLPPSSESDLPPLLQRLSFPRDWVVVLVIPSSGRKVSEEEESFMLSPAPPHFDQVLLLRGLMQLTNGILNKDLLTFSNGVETIQRMMGDYFEEYQGGKYSSNQTMASVEALRFSGAKGVGQSSWGPLAYGFILEESKSRVEENLRDYLRKEGVDAQILFTKARNRGASVSVVV
ncbi:MAG: hypothetical protein QW326_02195, partial [Fervidicoccaceae archaeon]